MSSDFLFQSRRIAEGLLGEIDWERGGLARCPGADLHPRGSTGKRDCRVFIGGDKPPTIYCVHTTSCAGAVAEKNRELRRAIGRAEWEHRRGLDPTLPERSKRTRAEQLRRARQRRLDDLASRARRALPLILADYRWPVSEMAACSPTAIGDPLSGILSLFDPDDVVWIGDRLESGTPRFRTRFRTAHRWLRERPRPRGPLMSAAVWRHGCYQRNASQIVATPFLVVESDTLTRDQMGAVFRWCLADHLPLRAVIDTGGRGIHGWFDRPADPAALQERIAALTALGCDPGPMRPVSMSRLPGAWRGERQQRLLWLDARKTPRWGGGASL